MLNVRPPIWLLSAPASHCYSSGAGNITNFPEMLVDPFEKRIFFASACVTTIGDTAILAAPLRYSDEFGNGRSSA